MLSGCALPRVGPDKAEIYQSAADPQGDTHVVDIDSRVARLTDMDPGLGFSQAFQSAGLLGSDTIRSGDTLGLTIWENVDDGLLSDQPGNQTILEEVQVGGSGFIFVPYAGRIKAAGNTPEAVRRVITEKLDQQTPDPQVEVRRVAGDGATVSVSGAVTGQGVYPIEAPTRTLSAMLAAAGGIAIPPEVAQIKVLRGTHSSRVWFLDLFEHPRHDIALRGGDRILVEADTRAYTVMGATGRQARVTFETQTLSALEALAQAGGLTAAASDPTGIFVLRNEPAEVANRVLGRSDLTADQRMIYVLDLTAPSGMFHAREFGIRDADTIYVTEAPFAKRAKIIAALTGTLGAVGSVSTAANTLGGDF
ncbi:polysaccharide biosynthesis/export family protein [Roseovarius sp. D22-M7]|uniref:polysaccharide biosynthesis/export family protein n=1 Tax=Roseovarius sp. D22-M7 TaxID=3127116 RepID=UPI0030104FD9